MAFSTVSCIEKYIPESVHMRSHIPPDNFICCLIFWGGRTLGSVNTHEIG